MISRTPRFKALLPLTLVICSFAALTLNTGVARAENGYYYVNFCQSATNGATSGWSFHTTGEADLYTGIESPMDCSPGSSMFAAVGGWTTKTPDKERAWLQFDAPSGTEIAGYHVNNDLTVNLGGCCSWSGGYGTYVTDSQFEYITNPCLGYSGCYGWSGWSDAEFAADSGVYRVKWVTGCTGNALCQVINNYLSLIYMNSGNIKLRDLIQPTFDDADGNLATASTFEGTVYGTISASDSQSGIRSAYAEVDGESIPLGAFSSTSLCPASGEYFDSVKPCPQSYEKEFSLDTTSLSEGEHTLRLKVEDAAGNFSTNSTRTITVDNVKAPAAPADGSEGDVSGALKVGEELTCNHGNFSGNNLTYSYQWRRDNSSIESEDKQTYEVVKLDEDHTLSCKVTATNSEGSASELINAGYVQVVSEEVKQGSETVTPLSPPSQNSLAATASTAPGEANGTNASRSVDLSGRLQFGKERTKLLRLRYGKRTAIEGKLLNQDGKPIKDATLTVRAAVNYNGKYGDQHPIGTVKTDDDGYYRYYLKAGPSRRVEIAYRAYSNDSNYSDVTVVETSVEAGARVRAPKVVHRGQRFLIKGRLLGKPCPSGAGVELQSQWWDGHRYARFGRGDAPRSRGCKIRMPMVFSKKKGGVRTGVIRIRLRLPTLLAGYGFTKGSSNTLKIKVIGNR